MKRSVLRFLYGVAFLLTICFATFVFLGSAPGDYVDNLRFDSKVSPSLLEELRRLYGLDQPPWIQFIRWLESVAEGKGGYSLSYRGPVFELVLPRLGNTLVLALSALAISWGLALLVGGLCGARAGGRLDRAVLMLVAAVASVPDVLLVLGGLWLAVVSGLPLGGLTSVDHEALSWLGRLGDRAFHLVLPVGVLVVASLPRLVRHCRSAVFEALEEPSVAAARGHGLEGPRLWWGYVLPFSANHLLTLFGVSFATLLSSCMVVEIVMGLPGFGPLFAEATISRDVHVVVMANLLAGLLLLFGNFLAEAMLWVLDPRGEEAL